MVPSQQLNDLYLSNPTNCSWISQSLMCQGILFFFFFFLLPSHFIFYKTPPSFHNLTKKFKMRDKWPCSLLQTQLSWSLCPGLVWASDVSIHGDMSCEALGRDRYPIPFALSVMNWFRRLQQRDSLRVYIVPPLPMDKSLEPSALAAGCCFRLPDSQYGPQSGSGGQWCDLLARGGN